MAIGRIYCIAVGMVFLCFGMFGKNLKIHRHGSSDLVPNWQVRLASAIFGAFYIAVGLFNLHFVPWA
jgi:hypothetical protein